MTDTATPTPETTAKTSTRAKAKAKATAAKVKAKVKERVQDVVEDLGDELLESLKSHLKTFKPKTEQEAAEILHQLVTALKNDDRRAVLILVTGQALSSSALQVYAPFFPLLARLGERLVERWKEHCKLGTAADNALSVFLELLADPSTFETDDTAAAA